MGNKELFNRVKRKCIFTKRRFLRKISSDFFGPREIRIYPIGYLCNLNCSMCWRSHNVSYQGRKKWNSLESERLKIFEYQNFFESLPPAVETIEIVGGGEPLLYPEIHELIKMIKKNFYIGSLITNGVLLRPKLIKTLLGLEWDEIRVSTHGSTPSIYKQVCGSDSFQLIWDNIRLFLAKRSKIRNRKVKSRLGVLFVIQKNNYQDVFNFGQLAQDAGCDYVEFDTVYPYKKSMLLKNKEVEQVIAQLKKVRANLSVKNNAHKIIELYRLQPHVRKDDSGNSKQYYQDKKCIIPSESLILDSFGNIHPCCFLDNSEPETINCGSFRETGDIWSIWLHKEYKGIRRKLRKGKFYNTCLNKCYYALPRR
jgi:MoaA/NifB/PqqE/SkfB family radical SAM enzyme